MIIDRNAPLLARLNDAAQASHESTLVLLGLASELVDHCHRMQEMAGRLQQRLEAAKIVPLPPPEEPFSIPRALRSGPTIRES